MRAFFDPQMNRGSLHIFKLRYTIRLQMRRTLSSIVLVLFVTAVFTPAAMASYTLKHNCCARIQAQQEEHCHGMNMPMGPRDGMHGMDMSKCGFCSPALSVSPAVS